jgi:hypothetical protein
MISTAKAFPKVSTDLRGQNRHVYDELVALQSVNDPTLASPYLKAAAVSTIAANGGTSGNFTVTINFPKYSVAVTTANILYNAADTAVQTAIDTALSGETILASYSAGHVDAGTCANMASAACAITANGASVNGAYMVLTTTNVDLDVAAPTVTENTVGTQNRPAEAILALYSAISPASTITPQGMTPSTGDYVTGDNPLSLSPGLQDLLIREIQVSEDATIGQFIRDIPDCVG